MGLPLPPLDPERAVMRITRFIADVVRGARARGVVVGVSGGVDSSTTAFLAVRALGPERVHVLIMPDPAVTPREDVEDAVSVAEALKVRYFVVDISRVFEAFSRSMPFFSREERVANGNLRARIRMSVLYYYANTHRLLVCGTGDKSELLLGYFTKYGDGGVDILPLGDLYKTQVRRLARYLGVPERIAFKPSSPRLWPGQMAEKELGFTYEEADSVLYHYVDLGMTVDQVVEVTGLPRSLVERIVRMVHLSEHKRMAPPVAKVTGTTVGLDWRMPFITYGV